MLQDAEKASQGEIADIANPDEILHILTQTARRGNDNAKIQASKVLAEYHNLSNKESIAKTQPPQTTLTFLSELGDPMAVALAIVTAQMLDLRNWTPPAIAVNQLMRDLPFVYRMLKENNYEGYLDTRGSEKQGTTFDESDPKCNRKRQIVDQYAELSKGSD
jgi:hypothetical protein